MYSVIIWRIFSSTSSTLATSVKRYGISLQATRYPSSPGVIKNEILEIMKEAKEKHYTPKLAPETIGKINVFGSVEEIASLVKQTGCEFCIDFAHILAREKKIDYELIEKSFPQKKWHVHFSGIEYGEKGEKRHKRTDEEELKNLLKNLPRNRDITIINESPEPVGDSILGLKLYKMDT